MHVFIKCAVQVVLIQSMTNLHEKHPTVTPIVLLWYILHRFTNRYLFKTIKCKCSLKKQTNYTYGGATAVMLMLAGFAR